MNPLLDKLTKLSRLAKLRWARNRRLAYRGTFCEENGEPRHDARGVLADLAAFCHATEAVAPRSTRSGMIDPIAMGIATGRREVWLRINGYLNLNDVKLAELEEQELDRLKYLEREAS